jgi:hypothetical protein
MPTPTYVRVMGGGDWRRGFEYAWQTADLEPDEGPGLTWRQLTPRHWSGTWDSKIRGTVTREGDGWIASVRLEDPSGPQTRHHRRPVRLGRGVRSSRPTKRGRRNGCPATSVTRLRPLLMTLGVVGSRYGDTGPR